MLPRQRHRNLTEAGVKFRPLLCKAHHRLLKNIVAFFFLSFYTLELGARFFFPVWCANLLKKMLMQKHKTPPGRIKYIFNFLQKLLLTDTHLLVISFCLLFFHICIIFFKCIIIYIWKPQKLLGKKKEMTPLSVIWTSIIRQNLFDEEQFLGYICSTRYQFKSREGLLYIEACSGGHWVTH